MSFIIIPFSIGLGLQPLAALAEMIPAPVEAVKNINVVVVGNLMEGVRPKNSQ